MQEAHVKKDVALEALRGLAAFIVVFWHMTLGLAPGHVPILPGQDLSLSILGKPWFGLCYGTSSVTFFFVLSGFVLSKKAITRSDPMILVRGAVKRWPRLAGPVCITVLFSWLLFITHAYRYGAAGDLTHSWWLSSFATAIPAGTVYKAKLGYALKEGLFSTFFSGTAKLDSSLWTMRIEFIGSFVVFGLAALLIGLRETRPIVRAWLLIVVTLICAYQMPFMACFGVGVALAALLTERSPLIPLWLGCALALLAIWLAGYYPGAGSVNWVMVKLHHTFDETYVHTAGSVLMIFVIEATPALRRRLSGRLSAALGKLSFPVYLLHVPVLCSAGAAVFLLTQGVLPGIGPKVAAAATTIVVTILLAWPLALFDNWWVGRIGVVTDKLIPRPVEKPDSATVELPYTVH